MAIGDDNEGRWAWMHQKGARTRKHVASSRVGGTRNASGVLEVFDGRGRVHSEWVPENQLPAARKGGRPRSRGSRKVCCVLFSKRRLLQLLAEGTSDDVGGGRRRGSSR